MATPTETGHLLAEIKRRSGLSWSALADTIGASSGDYVRKVASGAKPGRNLDAAVDELMATGRVSVAPTRRVTKAGKLALVRGAKGIASQTPLPRAPVTRKRGLFTMTAGRLGWEQELDARDTDAIRAAVRSVARGHHRVTFRVHYINADGLDEYVPLGGRGGYDPRDVLKKFGEDPRRWFERQCSGRYGGGPLAADDILGVEVVAS